MKGVEGRSSFCGWLGGSFERGESGWGQVSHLDIWRRFQIAPQRFFVRLLDFPLVSITMLPKEHVRSGFEARSRIPSR